MAPEPKQELANLASRAVVSSEDRASVEEALARLRTAGISTQASLIVVLTETLVGEKLLADAVWIAGVLQIRQAAQGIGRILQTHESPDLIWKASDSLALIRSPDQVDVLIAVVESRTEITRRCAAALALGAQHEPRAVKALRDLLVDRRNDAELRGYALEAFGRLRADEVATEVRAALKDGSPDVRYWAAYALGMIQDAAALPQLKLLVQDQGMTRSGQVVGDEAAWAIDQITGEGQTRA